MRENSLFRTVIEGRMVGKKQRGRPRMMMLDWLGSDGYGRLKKERKTEKNGDNGNRSLPMGRAPEEEFYMCTATFNLLLNESLKRLLPILIYWRT